MLSDCSCDVFLRSARGSFSNSHRPSPEGTFRVDAPDRNPIYAVD
jgi:hypothetical protein